MFRWKENVLAATELLLRLRNRPNWIHYLIKACSCPELGLYELDLHIKVEMSEYHVLKFFLSYCICIVSHRGTDNM